MTLFKFSYIQLKTKDQLDVTSYAFNMFRTLIYSSSGGYDYSVELPHWSCVLGSMCVGVSVWIGLEWYPCCRLMHHPVVLQPAPDDGYINVRNMLSA